MTSVTHYNPRDTIGKVACGRQSTSFNLKATTGIDAVTCANCRRSIVWRKARAEAAK